VSERSGDSIVRACLDWDVNYTEAATSFERLDEILRLREYCSTSRASVLAGAGLIPGRSWVLAAHLAGSVPRARDATTYVMLGPGDLHGVDAVRWMLHEGRIATGVHHLERVVGVNDLRRELQREGIALHLPELTSSLLGTDQAVLRIIDRHTGRTVTEWRHTAEGHAVPGGLRIRNRRVLSGTNDDSETSFVLLDAPEGFSTAAVIAADESSACDEGVLYSAALKRFFAVVRRVDV